jgi:hypothetical protein
LPQEGEKGDAADVTRAAQYLFVPRQECGVFLDEAFRVLRLLGNGSRSVDRGAANLVPEGAARDANGALGGGRRWPASRPKLFSSTMRSSCVVT